MRRFQLTCYCLAHTVESDRPPLKRGARELFLLLPA